jgi:hypothetical protein
MSCWIFNPLNLILNIAFTAVTKQTTTVVSNARKTRKGTKIKEV